jgi:GTP-dependent phosphoenolpyruvate carboxykinase
MRALGYFTDGYFRYSSYCRYCQAINPQIQVLVCAESKEEAEVIRAKILVKCSMQRRNGEEYEQSYFKSNQLAHHQHIINAYNKKRTLSTFFLT